MADKPKIGAGMAAAMLRMGAKELAQVLPAFNDGIKPVEELGSPGNLSPQEVVATKTKSADKDSFEADMAVVAKESSAKAAVEPSKDAEMDRD
jgi:hypothetical protein